MQYYGTKLSDNISRREPEGYLLCLNVPVARTGTQDYLPEELGLPRGPDPVPVFRPETEVFSPETVASFEGMPVTNDHPPDGVTIDNIRSLQKGHAHNVRRGAGDESDLLLADLIITDPGLIQAILDGKREISCGYMYELCEENGQYIQRKIRGNHVAVVDAGRAGHRVSIKDEQPSERPSVRESRSANGCHTTGACDRQARSAPTEQLRQSNHQPERRKPMKKSLLKKLTRMARDGDPEAVEALAEAVEEIIDPENAEAVVAAVAEPDPVEAVEEPAIVVETPENEVVVDENPGMGEILSRLDRIISLLTPAAADEDPVEEIMEAVEEALGEALMTAGGGNLISGEVSRNEQSPQCGAATIEAAEIAATVAEAIEEAMDPVSEVIGEGDDCGDPDCRPSADALRAALVPMRAELKQMSPSRRREVCADIAARMRKASVGDSSVLAVALSRKRPAEPDADLGKKIMAKRNPNYSGQ